MVIGYAFHDKLLNSELTAAVNNRADVRVLVVDPGITRHVKRSDCTYWDAPFEFLKLGPADFRSSSFAWIRGKFGDKTIANNLMKAIDDLGD